jgi:hypothetical protein
VNVDWKKLSQTYLKALLGSKVLMLLFLLGTIVYYGGYETIYKTNMVKLTALDKQLKEKNEDYTQRKEDVENLKRWEEELKEIKTVVIELEEEQSTRVEAVNQTRILTELIRGVGREYETLPEPHDTLELISFKPTADTVVDIVSQTPLPKADAAPPPINMARFDFEVRVKGTYPALVDLINHLVLSQNLLVINKVLIKKGNPKDHLLEPDPLEKPDHPVLIEMFVYLSLYIYDPKLQQAA